MYRQAQAWRRELHFLTTSEGTVLSEARTSDYILTQRTVGSKSFRLHLASNYLRLKFPFNVRIAFCILRAEGTSSSVMPVLAANNKPLYNSP
jgi:hypothetical protein